MQPLMNAIKFIRTAKLAEPHANKARLQALYREEFAPGQSRKVLVGEGYAFYFSEISRGGYSNTGLALSALKGHDNHPFVIVIVRPLAVEFLLANSTLLNKLSVAAREFRTDNIRGSFNLSDIMRTYNDRQNEPACFDQLFAQHQEFTWEENVKRLVEKTNQMVPRLTRFSPTPDERAILMQAPLRAQAALTPTIFGAIEAELKGLVRTKTVQILDAATLENGKLRGERIEQQITGGNGAHALGDLERIVEGIRVVIDVKTSLLNLKSAPKAYNVNKALALMSEPGTVLAVFMIGIDTNAGTVTARLLPVLEDTLLDTSEVRHHWAGLASRGSVQFSRKFHLATEDGYVPKINIDKAKGFLEKLLDT